jgi:hypothetical protein
MPRDERERRRAAIGKSASEKIAKSEQLNFRLEAQSIRELQNVAYEKGLPLGTMIRDWVLERLAQEKLGKTDMNAGRAVRMLSEIHQQLDALFGAQGDR